MPAKASAPSVEPRIRINHGRAVAFGPGKAELLELIASTGSISEAARLMEMSYMRAWKLVQSLEKGFAEPLVLKSRGGRAKGGAQLSPTGEEVLRIYREMERACADAVAPAAGRLRALLGG